MAMIDYGAIAFKNGKLISTDMFTPMKDMVGWEDCKTDVYRDYNRDKYEPLKLKGNYFAYIGDADCTIGFYKTNMVIVERYDDGTFNYRYEWLMGTHYEWSKWWDYVGIRDEGFPKLVVTKRNGYLVCKWKYKGDRYKVYFGYGVDLGSYEKYRIVNYYRSPMYLVHKIPREIKNKIWDWKHGY